eukprot:7379926-Prymnesium_polylepis.1
MDTGGASRSEEATWVASCSSSSSYSLTSPATSKRVAMLVANLDGSSFIDEHTCTSNVGSNRRSSLTTKVSAPSVSPRQSVKPSAPHAPCSAKRRSGSEPTRAASA